MAQVEQNLLPTTIIQETQFHTDDAMSTQESTQEVVEHESDLVAQTSQKPSNDMTKVSENMLPTIGETQIYESNTRNSEHEKIVMIDHQSDLVVLQTSPKPSTDMIKDTNNMPLRDEDVEGSEKKDEDNKELQDTLATKEVQAGQGTEKVTQNMNIVQSIEEREQGAEGDGKKKGT